MFPEDTFYHFGSVLWHSLSFSQDVTKSNSQHASEAAPPSQRAGLLEFSTPAARSQLIKDSKNVAQRRRLHAARALTAPVLYYSNAISYSMFTCLARQFTSWSVCRLFTRLSKRSSPADTPCIG